MPHLTQAGGDKKYPLPLVGVLFNSPKVLQGSDDI